VQDKIAVARNRTASRDNGTVLILSQVFVPDPAANGQYLADVADGLVERGVGVRVLTASRGYDDPSVVYERRSLYSGVDVRRLPLSSFGKRNLLVRIAAQLSFLLQCIVHGLFTRNIGSILVATSPPMANSAALIVGTLRRVPVTYWVMDINPDQAIVTGMVSERSLAARMLAYVDRSLLRRAAGVITLDTAMAERLRTKADIDDRLAVVPVWPLAPEADEGKEREFSAEHNPDGRFLVMYCGNHSLVNPLATLLDAISNLADRSDLLFMFIGGGLAKKQVETVVANHPDGNIISLPYQPLEDIGGTLAAADVHVVTMGDDMVGLIHPSKIYGALSAGRPILYIGPPSPLSGVIEDFEVGWVFRHGDTAGVVQLLQDLPARHRDSELAEMGHRARTAAKEHFSRAVLREKVVNVVVGDM
jgi:glycosyltransferase involved in cell wall biosynthesis